MLIEVFNLHAAVAGMATTWRGEIPDELVTGPESIYRLLNRVTEGDHERMLSWGYELPSLSVGDLFTIHNQDGKDSYQVVSFGFRKITGDHEYLLGVMLNG